MVNISGHFHGGSTIFFRSSPLLIFLPIRLSFVTCAIRSRMTFPAMLASFVSCSLSFFNVNFLIINPLIQTSVVSLSDMESSLQLHPGSSVTDDQRSKEQKYRRSKCRERQIRHINNSSQIQNNRNKTTENHKNLPHNITLPVSPVYTHQNQNSCIN